MNFRIGVAVAAAVLLVTASARADAAGPYNWTGFYAGGYAGYGWGKSTATDIGDRFGVPEYILGAQFSDHPDGFIGGGQAGYNYQSGNWVAGLEADFGYLGLKGSGVYPDGTFFDTFVKTRASYDATFRARFGVTNGPVLFYVTGGAILADFNNYIKSFSTFHSDKTGSQWGWTVGAGIEYALDRKWSVKAEYLYYDAGTETVRMNNSSGNPFPIESTGNLVRVGLNYRFGN